MNNSEFIDKINISLLNFWNENYFWTFIVAEIVIKYNNEMLKLYVIVS